MNRFDQSSLYPLSWHPKTKYAAPGTQPLVHKNKILEFIRKLCMAGNPSWGRKLANRVPSAGHLVRNTKIWNGTCVRCNIGKIIDHLYPFSARYPRTYVPTYLRTYVPTYLRTYVPKYQRTYEGTYVPTYLRTYVPTYQRTYVPTYLRTHVPTYLRTHLPTYLRTYRVLTYVRYLRTYVSTFLSALVLRHI